jgi:hypothetical protein
VADVTAVVTAVAAVRTVEETPDQADVDQVDSNNFSMGAKNSPHFFKIFTMKIFYFFAAAYF